MRRVFLPLLTCLLTIGFAEEESEPKFAHFLEPGFPFAEIVVDARELGEGFPEDNLTPRGLVVRLAEDTYIAYDTDLCRVACAWTGGFLTEESLATKSYHHAKKKKDGGQAVLPKPIGTPIFANGLYPGVQLGDEPVLEDPRPAEAHSAEVGRGALPEGMARWGSRRVVNKWVILEYKIGDYWINEIPELLEDDAIARYFLLEAPTDRGLVIALGTGHCELVGKIPGAKIRLRNGVNFLTIPRAEESKNLRFSVVQSCKKFEGKLPDKVHPTGWPDFKNNWSEDHWPKSLETQGTLAKNDKPYVLDSIPLPLKNTQSRNVRPSGIDFFDDGVAAVVTYDGDVWMVNGLRGDLKNVIWRRIAAGLHEPNSIRIVNNLIYVFGRNGITFLLPEGMCRTVPFEVPNYVNHCSDFWQSAETRDFAHSMAIARDGSFFITKGGQQNDLPSKHSGRVLKISADGKKVEVYASGLRNGYLTIRPGTDEIYASDQQGHWVPATPVHRIVEGGYYGFKPAAPWGVPEPLVTPPLCWIPHAVAGSGLEPVWADKKRFGSLSDSLVYLDFQRPGLLRTYLHDREGQAATVPMPLEFDFPLLKGAVNPVDGQLYVVGFQIWGTSAEKIRGMARVRYTGKPSVLPTRVVAGENAIALHFEQALDPKMGSFTVRRWNYKRSGSYGSGHYRPDGEPGEEILAHGGHVFSADRRAVLVSTPDLEPVNQLAISYDLKTADGQTFSNAAYLTLHETSALDLGSEGFPDADLAVLIEQRPKAGKSVISKPSRERGRTLHTTLGCAGCHSIDGSKEGKSGPTWKNLAGSQRTFRDGSRTVADTTYLREAILDPTASVVDGYNPQDVGMPSYRGILSDADLESMILFIQSLSGER